jgi:tripeptidyl-peptidase-1
VPAELREHIDMIQPTTRFGQIHEQISQIHDIRVMEDDEGVATAGLPPVNATCNTRITPDCLKNLYNFANFTPSQDVHTLIGVSGFLEQYARFKDYARFVSLFAPDKVNTNFTWTSVNGMSLAAVHMFSTLTFFRRNPGSTSY